MNTFISATDLKKNVSEILNKVRYGKKVAIIERFGKPVAKIVPFDDSTKTEKNLTDKIKNYFGVLPDFPEVASKRYFKRRRVSL